MAKISAVPIRFSDHFKLNGQALAERGVLDPTLNIDTALFIDPLLVPHSQHKEIRVDARAAYQSHFEQVIKLLKASKAADDVAWRNAKRLMEFPEVKWTCLGYGAGSVSGSGSGAFTTNSVMKTAKEIVELGIEDPDLFVAMGIFEEGIGPDRISDMTTNVIMPGLLSFNRRILSEIAVPKKSLNLVLKNGKRYNAELAMNPFFHKETPILLVPTDILRDLPIAKDWSEISDAAAKGAALRADVNDQIAQIWRSRTLKDKDELRRWALSSGDAFDDLLHFMKTAKSKPYDIETDPAGELIWRKVSSAFAAEQLYFIEQPRGVDADSVAAVVERIIEGFRFLIEERRFSEELYSNEKARPEKSAQCLFFAAAYFFCKANNLDITPEADTGNGPVDFKIASGFKGRVLVEIKLSTNNKLVPGYSRQLETYKNAEETTRAFYVVLDVGGMGEKDEKLIALKNELAAEGHRVSPVVFIDGTRRPSASKLK